MRAVVDGELRKCHGPSPFVSVAVRTVSCSLDTGPLTRFGASSFVPPHRAHVASIFSSEPTDGWTEHHCPSAVAGVDAVGLIVAAIPTHVGAKLQRVVSWVRLHEA